jgi:excisionase family DNA binding protein
LNQTDAVAGNSRRIAVDSSVGSMNNLNYLRPKELAERLSVSPRQLRQWQHDGVIPFLKIGQMVLFDPAKVAEALSRFERNAGLPKASSDTSSATPLPRWRARRAEVAP